MASPIYESEKVTKEQLFEMRLRTHCPKGHEYSYSYLNSKGGVERHCRQCMIEASREWRIRKKEAALRTT